MLSESSSYQLLQFTSELLKILLCHSTAIYHFLKKLIREDCLVALVGDGLCVDFAGLSPNLVLLLAAMATVVAAATVSVSSSLLASVDTSS